MPVTYQKSATNPALFEVFRDGTRISTTSDEGYAKSLSDPVLPAEMSGPVNGEPAVLSSVSGRENFQSDIKPKIDRANQAAETAAKKREYQTTYGNELLSDDEARRRGFDIPPDVQAELDAAKTEEERIYEKRLAAYDTRISDAKRMNDSLTIAQTTQAKSQIASLTREWEERRRLLEQSNNMRLSNWNQQFIRSGQAEYSPGMTADMISQKEEEGIRSLKSLDDQYNSKIAEINAALDAKQFAQAALLTSEISKIEESALTIMAANAKEAREANEKIKKSMMQASRDSAIADLVGQGITDTADLLDMLNYDDSGTQVGDFTADEIEKVRKIVDPDESLAGLTTDYRTYKYLKENDPESVKGMSYFQFLAAASNAKRKAEEKKGSGGTAVDIPSFDEFVDEFMATPEGKALITELEGERRMTLRPEARREAVAESVRDIYDEAVGAMVDQSGNDFQKARLIIDRAETKDWDALRADLLEQTDLSATEIDSLLRAGGVEKKKATSSSTGSSEEMTDEEFKAFLEGK